MKLKSGRLPLFLSTLILAAGGFVLRWFELRDAYDAPGLPSIGSGLALALCVLCALAVLLLLLGCGAIPKREEFARCFPPCVLCLIVSVIGAAALLFGSGIGVWNAIPHEEETLSILAILPGFCGIVGALCIFLAAYGRYQGARPMTALYLIPFFFIVIRLVIDFKTGWSSDPAILDYCFDLFAMLAAMSATYHLAGFCFDRGRRARTVFWCLVAVLFCVISLAGAEMADRMTYGGIALWLLANAWQLLGPAARVAAPTAEAPDPDMPANSDEPADSGTPADPAE